MVGLHLGKEADPPAFLTQVHDRPDAGFLDGPHGQLQLGATIALEAAKSIACQTFRVDAHEGGFGRGQVADRQEGVLRTVLWVNEGVQVERPERRRKHRLCRHGVVAWLNADGHDC